MKKIVEYDLQMDTVVAHNNFQWSFGKAVILMTVFWKNRTKKKREPYSHRAAREHGQLGFVWCDTHCFVRND